MEVGIGSIVAVRFLPYGPDAHYLIVDQGSPSNPEQGIISCNAPLACALLGHSAGDTVMYEAPHNTNKRVKLLFVVDP